MRAETGARVRPPQWDEPVIATEGAQFGVELQLASGSDEIQNYRSRPIGAAPPHADVTAAVSESDRWQHRRRASASADGVVVPAARRRRVSGVKLRVWDAAWQSGRGNVVVIADRRQFVGLTSAELERRMLHRRAVEAVVWGMPAVNYDATYQALVRDAGGGFNQVVY